MMRRRMVGIALVAGAMLPGAAHADGTTGTELSTTVCTPSPAPELCVDTAPASSQYGAHCEAYVAAYQIGDPTTTITMYAYVYDTGATWTSIYCEALHDGSPVFAVYAYANGPSAQAYSVGTISTDALPSSLYCDGESSNVSILCT